MYSTGTGYTDRGGIENGEEDEVWEGRGTPEVVAEMVKLLVAGGIVWTWTLLREI
jgi:hypothetical protein